MKVARIVEWNRHGLPLQEIAQSIGIHCTTVTCILKRFEKLGDFYHINPQTGQPCKMDLHESWIAAWMIAKVEAANAVEVQKRAFPEVSARTVEAFEGTEVIVSCSEV